MCFLLILPLVPVACGSSGASPRTTKELGGPGFSVSVPAAWDVYRTARSVTARHGRATVSATVTPIGKAYDPSQFAAAAKELDALAARAAAAAGGTVAQARTSTVAGRRIRAYSLATPTQHVEIGFLLDGRREYQLLCEAPRAAAFPDAACALLFSSFALR